MNSFSNEINFQAQYFLSHLFFCTSAWLRLPLEWKLFLSVIEFTIKTCKAVKKTSWMVSYEADEKEKKKTHRSNNWSKVAPRLLKWFKFLWGVKEPDGFKIQFLSFSKSLRTHHLAEKKKIKHHCCLGNLFFIFIHVAQSLLLSRIFCGLKMLWCSL